MQCKSCGADLPDDARFCIECGAHLRPAASTGETVALPRLTEIAEICPACGAANPSEAIFCVRCGQRMSEASPASAPGPGTPQRLARSAPAPAPPIARRRGRGGGHGAITGAIMLIGLGALLLLKLPFWPGILIVVGLASFLGEAMRGRYINALSSVLWLFGLAFLFMVPRLWWPGILVLVGLSVLLGLLRQSTRCP